MAYLILGLVIFLGAHSVRIFAERWRARVIVRLGAGPWRAVYSVVSIVGFVLIAWGYGQARAVSGVLYETPYSMRYLTALFTLLSFVLVAAAYVPANQVKPAVGHPMAAGVKLWAFAHLLSNGTVAGVVLFGAFLIWAIADYLSARKRDRAAGVQYPAGTAAGTAATVLIGLGAWAVFAFWAHAWLIGTRPFA